MILAMGLFNTRASGKCSPSAFRTGVRALGPQPGPPHLSVFCPQRGTMGGKPLSTFYTQLVLVPKVLQYAQYVLLALGGLLLLVPIIYQLRSRVSVWSSGGYWGRGSSWVGLPLIADTYRILCSLLCLSWKAQDIL